MFKSNQLEKILKEKNSAFKVLIATQKKLKASCKKASDFISLNSKEVVNKEKEIDVLKVSNNQLDTQIKLMEASISQTENIINPIGIVSVTEKETKTVQEDVKENA